MINAAQIDRLAQPDCDGELLLWQASLVSYRPLALIKVLKSRNTARDTGGLSRFAPHGTHAAKDIARAFCYVPGLPEPIAEGIITQP